MKSNQKVWWVVLVGTICFAALLFAMFGRPEIQRLLRPPVPTS